MFAPGDRALVEKMPTFKIEHGYLEKINNPKSPKAVLSESLPKVAQKRIIAEKP